MLLASRPHYHTTEGGIPSNSGQHSKHGTCSVLNTEITLASQRYRCYLKSPTAEIPWGCNAKVTLGFLTGCPTSALPDPRRESPQVHRPQPPKVPPEPPSRYHVQKANRIPEPKWVKHKNPTATQRLPKPRARSGNILLPLPSHRSRIWTREWGAQGPPESKDMRSVFFLIKLW